MAKRGYKLQEFVAHTSDVTCVHIGKKSCRVFVTGGEDRKVNLWAIGKPTIILSLSGHTSSVQSVTFDSTEVLVLGGSSSGMIKLWDLEESKNVRSLTGHRSNCTAVEFHPFGEFFASGSLDTDLKVWDIRKKGCIHTYKGHTRGIRTIKFTPDGRWVVTGGEDNVVKLWDLTAGKLLYDFKCHSGPIRCIDFHPHEFLLATGSADRTVKFWDLETFELIDSVGPEATGVRSMIFHPDGKTLFCGLDESLKVFSWEPIRCHDTVELGWSTLGDLSIYEGKLLGCSYYQSRVGVWVSDIELIGPYGIMPKTIAVMEPLCSHEDYRIVEPTGSITISITKSVAGPLDCGSKTKENVETPLMISNECRQSIQQDFDRASNTTPMNSTGFRKNSATVNCHSAPSKFDSRFSKKSSVNSSTFRGIKATASRSIAPNGTKSSFASRDMPLRSAVLHANSSLALNKGPMIESIALNKGPMIESITVNNIQALSRSASMPVIIPRDRLEQETASCRKVTAATETSHGTALFKSKHMQNSSLVGGGSESQLIATVSEPLSGMGNDISGTGSNFLSRLEVNGGTVLADEQKHLNIRNIAERFERIVSVEQPVGLHIDKHDESTFSSNESSSVKYVKGVAVQLGRIRSLVESWERRDSNSSLTSASGTFSDQVGGAENFSCVQKVQVHTSERDTTSGDDSIFPETLLQNHDVFINVVKSRLTKLQVVLHFWEKNDIKGAIDAVAKLPDHSVQVDVISILGEKTGLFTLDLFSCLLPVIDGLLISKTERHVTVCLEILLELVKIFGPVIHSTISTFSSVGVDLQAEQRLERCNQCLNHFVKIKQVLPSLIRSGGLIAKHAQELTLVLHDI